MLCSQAWTSTAHCLTDGRKWWTQWWVHSPGCRCACTAPMTAQPGLPAARRQATACVTYLQCTYVKGLELLLTLSSLPPPCCTQTGGGYGNMSGSSAAAPVVAGVAALVVGVIGGGAAASGVAAPRASPPPPWQAPPAPPGSVRGAAASPPPRSGSNGGSGGSNGGSGGSNGAGGQVLTATGPFFQAELVGVGTHASVSVLIRGNHCRPLSACGSHTCGTARSPPPCHPHESCAAMAGSGPCAPCSLLLLPPPSCVWCPPQVRSVLLATSDTAPAGSSGVSGDRRINAGRAVRAAYALLGNLHCKQQPPPPLPGALPTHAVPTLAFPCTHALHPRPGFVWGP